MAGPLESQKQDVLAQISELFKDAPDLRSDFRIFMPDKSQQLFDEMEGNMYLAQEPRRGGTPLMNDAKHVRRKPDLAQSPPAAAAGGSSSSTLPLKRKRKLLEREGERERDKNLMVASGKVALGANKVGILIPFVCLWHGLHLS